MKREALDALTRHNAERLASAWTSVLEQPEGRLIMWDLINRCGVNAPVLSEAGTMQWLEGRRSVGMELISSYLAPQGAACHAKMLIEAEARALEMLSAQHAAKEEAEDEGFGTV